MPLSSNSTTTGRFIDGGPAPFASLTPVPRSHRSWSLEFLLTPFRDQDERANYKSAQQRQAAASKGADMAAFGARAEDAVI
ncbi:MAG TPA: hypothetical protein VND87_00850 [Stellaceae bacterium]|nr:hypothetical protein [Stellaceae bacterium]